MSKIIRITTTNTKGINLDEKLTGRELYLGKNGSGKSTRLESLIIGLQGHINWLGKTPEASFQISSGDSFTVNLATDDGFSFGRTIRRKEVNHKDGSKSRQYQASHSVFPDKGESKDSQKKERIATEVGSSSVLFDINKFINGTESDKRELIFSLSSPESHGWDQDRVISEIKKLGCDADWIAKNWPAGKNVADSVDAVRSLAGKALSAAQAVEKSKIAAKAEIIVIRQTMMEEAGGDLSEIRNNLKGLRDEKVKTEKDISASEESFKQQVLIRTRKEMMERELAAMDRLEHVDIEEIEARLKNIIDDEIPACDLEAESLARYAQELLKESARHLAVAMGKDRDLARVDRRSELGEAIAAAKKFGCPVMGSECKTDLADYIRKLEGKVSAVEEEVESLRSERDESMEKGEELKKSGEDLVSQAKDLLAKGKRLAKDSKPIQKELREASKEEARRTAVSASLEKERKSIDEARRSLTPIVSTEASKALLGNINIQVSEFEAKERKAQEIQNVMANFDSANISAIEASEEVEKMKVLRDALGPKGVQSQIMGDVIGPMTASVNGLLSKIPPHDGVPYEAMFKLFDMNGNPTFEIVRACNGTHISYNALSGGQQVLFGAAIMTALVLMENPPVKAICIEAAELDLANFQNLISALDVIGKDIDNIMIASCSDKVEEWASSLEDWNVCNLV